MKLEWLNAENISSTKAAIAKNSPERWTERMPFNV